MSSLDFGLPSLLHRSSSVDQDVASNVTLFAGTVCLVWYVFIACVGGIGYLQLRRHYSSPPPPATVNAESPHVTIIRPVKGLEPSLYECLAATFRQRYPPGKLSIFFCISDRQDPALPVLQRLLQDFPSFDAHLLVEDEDPRLQGSDADNVLGPNPKIRNMSRAYREGKGDIIWIIDCNVWVAPNTCGRMVDTLHGQKGAPNKFVHLLPLVVDTVGTPIPEYAQGLLDDQDIPNDMQAVTSSTASHQLRSADDVSSNVWRDGGGRLEEAFMSSSHAKFYTAINTVLVAPCAVGKSTMFRRSHLDSLTEGRGIDYFSENICEDHLIGDLLWKNKVPEEERGVRMGKHAMVFGDLAIQPMAEMSVSEYIARRVRWLRVRKFTVTLATLVEPGTECFLCSLYGAFAMTTLPIFRGIVSPTWLSFFVLWLTSVSAWAFVDWTLYVKLHSATSITIDEHTPHFARPPKSGKRRPLSIWLSSWLAREALAFPIWVWAVFGGVTVVWRGKKLWVGMDMKVHEYEEEKAKDKDRCE